MLNKNTKEVVCDLDYKEFNIECRRIFKIFINTIERPTKFGNAPNDAFLDRESKRKQMAVTETKKENERLELIKDTLKTSIKLRTKLKEQLKIISNDYEINEELVKSHLLQNISKLESS